MRTLVYYNKGTKCLIRLAVALFTAREHWSGPIIVLQSGCDEPSWIKRICEDLHVTIQNISLYDGNALCTKPMLWKFVDQSPGNSYVFMDSDTLIQTKELDSLFELVEEHKIVLTRFADWTTTGRKLIKRIESFRGIIGEYNTNQAIRFGKAVNTGVFGWSTWSTGANEFFQKWEKLTLQGYHKNCSRRIVDEVACQVLLHNHPWIHITDSSWNSSVRWPAEETKIYHFHGSKHVKDLEPCKLWKNQFWKLVYRFPNLRPQLSLGYGDKRFNRYISEVIKSDLTVVTAVNERYFGVLEKNFPTWTTYENLREQNFVIFFNGLTQRQLDSEFWTYLKQLSWVNLIPWNPEGEFQNQRELMLTAFVVGVAEHVKTDYWMKLDGDVSVVPTETWTWPNYHRHTLIGHKWGYTKVKGDSESKKHWLNILDEHAGTSLFPPIDPSVRRFSHARVCSFASIEKTSHTRDLVQKYCKKNRLIIPTQDTTSWFEAASNPNKSVFRMNMKRWFKP